MRSKWFKALSIVVVLSLALTMLAACGGESESDQPGTPPEGGKTETEQSAGDEITKEVEIAFWEQDDPGSVDPVWDEIINDFMAENPNVKVERTHYENEAMRQNYQTAVLGGEGPEVISGPYDNIGVFGTSGTIAPIEEIFSQDFIDTFLPNALEGVRYNGKLYGVPYRIGNTLTLIYNKKFVDQAPETMDEMIAKAKELTTGDQYGFVYNLTEPFFFIPFLGGYKGRVFDENTNITLDTDAMQKALQLVHDFKFTHKIIPAEANYDVASNLFKEGKAAMIINGPWSFKEYRDAGLDIGLTRIPKITETDTYPAPYTGGKVLVINKDVPGGDPNVKLAVRKFLEFVNTKENQLKLAEVTGELPTNAEASKDAQITSDPTLAKFNEQMLVGTPMPIIPEMRAVWDGIRPGLEGVMGDTMTPEEAAKEMQEKAEQLKKEMLGE